MKYSLFIGRFQCVPLHFGHIKLIRTVLDEGKSVLIALRLTDKDKDNPYSVGERRQAFEQAFKKEIYNGRMRIIIIPDILEICFGRKLGYGIREIKLDKKTEAISATQIRKDKKKDKKR